MLTKPIAAITGCYFDVILRHCMPAFDSKA